MEEATAELLSRHLDGDLAPDEEKAFLEQLAAQPELQEELNAMARLRDAVRTFAEQDEPPAELSALLEPLRRSRPPRVGVRPAYRWLAAAAAVVLAVMVTSELLHKGPAVPESSQVAAQSKPQPTSGYFKLKPLPKSGDDDLVGATDHLMASPPPEIELDNPPLLEVMGPLEDEPSLQDRLGRDDQPPPQPVAVPGDQPAPELAEGSVSETVIAAKQYDGAADGRRGRHILGRTMTCTMSLIVDGTTVLSQPCAPGQTPSAGRHPVVISIADGKIVELRADVATRSEPAASASLFGDLVGLTLSETVADGEHQAFLQVE